MSASRYRLVRTIASGGMAHIYEAVALGDRGFERRVAIKRILPQHARDEAMRRMFFDEASIAGCLHHANLVQVLDFGVVDEDDFIAMEYVDGIDADRALAIARRGGAAMPEVLALHVTAEVAHALAYAHALADDAGEPLGIVHRDVSPHNNLLAWDGHVKLGDFGIALATRREEKTRTGVVKGKLAYMPLEQAAGGRVSAAADVYALGVTLHALATGSPPSEAPSPEPELDTSLAEGVRALVRDCLARDPSARPSAADVAERAGRLAARSLDRDARGALCEWLASLDARGKAVSALDDLMGLDLVVADDAPGGGARRFTVARLAAAMPAQAAPRASEASIHLPTNRRGLAAILTIVAAAIATLVLFAAFSADDEEPARARTIAAREPREAAHGASGPMDPPRASVDGAIARAGLEPAPLEPSGAGGPVSPEPSPHARREPRERPLVTPAPPRAPDPPPPAPAELARGYVRIPRAGETQEQIEIDGRARGFTPAMIELDAGAHRVLVRSVGSDAVVLEREIVLEAHHTRIAPLVLAR